MRISTLGPKGTFSDIACQKFIYDAEIVYSHSIRESFKVLDSVDYVVAPIENALDGYVQETLDLLIQNDCQIIRDVLIPVQFKYVGNVSFDKAKKIYVQFKTKGQCLDFLSKTDSRLVITESNIESLDLLENDMECSGAIVPMHVSKEFPYINENISDNANNETRFILATRHHQDIEVKEKFKMFIVVRALVDKPGLLYSILKRFKEKNINLLSIMSRPTKVHIGKYNFFIELEGNGISKNDLVKIINDIQEEKEYITNILGIY